MLFSEFSVKVVACDRFPDVDRLLFEISAEVEDPRYIAWELSPEVDIWFSDIFEFVSESRCIPSPEF